MEDDFAQSRGADDLFMDELESPPNESAGSYVDPPSQVQPSPKPAQLSGENLERHTQAHYDREYEAQKYGSQKQHQTAHNNQNGGRGGRRGRGRGRGGNENAPRQNNNPRQQQNQQGATNTAAVNTPLPAQPAQPATSPHDATSPAEQPQTAERIDETTASLASPTGPAAQHRIQAVRGDRTATGPPKPKRRTEAEITELMAKMKLKSSAASLAHEKSKKDQEAFEQREREAAKERAEKVVRERQNVRAMDSERAKNAIRKQKAMQGREWDSEKQDSDIVGESRGSSSRYMKGANGGIARDVAPSRDTEQRMQAAAKAVRSAKEDFPALGAAMSGARGAAGSGGGIGAKQGGRELFPNGPGQPSNRGRNNQRGASRGGARGGGGLGASRYADAAAGAPESRSKRSMNTDIRSEEVEQKEAEEVKAKDVEDKKDPEAVKIEFEELKKADEGKKMNWAEEANDAA